MPVNESTRGYGTFIEMLDTLSQMQGGDLLPPLTVLISHHMQKGGV